MRSFAIFPQNFLITWDLKKNDLSIVLIFISLFLSVVEQCVCWSFVFPCKPPVHIPCPFSLECKVWR